MIVATIDDSQHYTWESQARQYPITGPKGISYMRGPLADPNQYVDCLLFRNNDRELVGILNHYPMDIPPFEKVGMTNTWVRPDHQRQGIGTLLMTEAMRRWPDINLDKQRYTQAGAAFARKFMERNFT